MAEEVRNRYSPRVRVTLACPKSEMRTKQSFADACDINKIMDRYKKTGLLPTLARKQPVYGDFSDVPSYQKALELVSRAEQSFAALPAQVRAECQNDPSVFLAAVKDPKFRERHKEALEGTKAAYVEPNPPQPSNPPKAAPVGAAPTG